MGHTLSFANEGQRRFNYRIALHGVIGSLLIWSVVIALALIHDGTKWPQAAPAIPRQEGFPGRPAVSSFEAWENLAMLGVVVEFLILKSWAMIRRQQWDRRDIDWLTVGLILPNIAFAVVYLYSIGGMLFDWQTTADVRRFLLRYPLIIVLALGSIQLCKVPDRPDDDTP